MSPFDAILGQEMAVSALKRAADSGRLATSYLFYGPSGVGKQLAARAFATVLIAADDPNAPHRIEEDNHPDVRVFLPREEGKRNIQVEYLRQEILPLTRYAPFEATRSFFIFPDADVSFPDFQPEAANAILKTLEEPRPGVHFILTASRPTALLPTIRSRCQAIPFRPLSPSVLEGILRNAEVPDGAIPAAAALSGGRADIALALAQDDLAESIVELVLETDEVVRGNRPGALLDSAESIARHPQFELALRTMQTLYRDMALAQLGVDGALSFGHQATEVRSRAEHLSPSAAAARVARIHETLVAIRQNANPQLATDSLLFDLKRLR